MCLTEVACRSGERFSWRESRGEEEAESDDGDVPQGVESGSQITAPALVVSLAFALGLPLFSAVEEVPNFEV